MAGKPLKLSPQLIPYWQLGLRFILQDKPIENFNIELKQNNQAEQNNPRQAVAVRQNIQSNQNNNFRANQQNVAPKPQTAQTNGQAQARSEADFKTTAPTKAPQAPSLEFKKWPELWRKIFLKGAPNPAPIVWTYSELGLDLLGQGDPQRGIFFRNILSKLSIPKGGNAFWAAAIPKPHAQAELKQDKDSNTELEFNQKIFEAGLLYIKPKVIIVFGKECLEEILPPELLIANPSLKDISDFQQIMAFRAKILLLPSVSQLQNDASKSAASLPLIQNLLTGLFK